MLEPTPKRICHVNLSKGFRGGERQTCLLIIELAKKGYTQELVCRPNSPLNTELAHVDKLSFRHANTPLHGHGDHQHSQDLLHAHDGRAVHWCMLENLLKKTPYVVTRRVPNPLKDSYFTRFSYRRAAAIVALSRAIQRNLNNYCEGLSTCVIPSMCSHLPANPASIAALKQQFKGKFVVGHVGALVNKHKGQSYLIEAARQLRISHPQLQFIFLGQGADEARLKAQAKELSNIEFIGFKTNVGDYLAAMDLFVFPSLEEGLGSILFDVMDYRVPIIASDVDGIPDIVEHGVNGLLVAPADSDALVNAIKTLYNAPELAQKLTQESTLRLPQFSPSNIASRYQTLYQQLLDKS